MGQDLRRGAVVIVFGGGRFRIGFDRRGGLHLADTHGVAEVAEAEQAGLDFGQAVVDERGVLTALQGGANLAFAGVGEDELDVLLGELEDFVDADAAFAGDAQVSALERCFEAYQVHYQINAGANCAPGKRHNAKPKAASRASAGTATHGSARMSDAVCNAPR